MVLFTLIAREMRAAARQPATYFLRLPSVAALMVVLAVAVLENRDGLGGGGEVLARLHWALLIAIWVMVPLLTADCISRERREQTLPLLFLTPLKPWQIILAKAMAYGLRAITLWLAVIPVLAIPFLIGGVQWQEVVLSVLLNFDSICLAIAAALLASACARVWMRSVVLAACFALLFFFGFVIEAGIVFSFSSPSSALSFPISSSTDVPNPFNDGLAFVRDLGTQTYISPVQIRSTITMRSYYGGPRFFTPLSTINSAPSATIPGTIETLGIVSLSCLVALLLAIGEAALIVRRNWREKPPSAQAIRVRQIFCTPQYFKPLFQRWMRWEMGHNPIGWLEQRTWSSRLVSWSWLAVFVCVCSSLLANLGLYRRALDGIETIFARLLALSVAVCAAGSFRRERETGMLELLAVSPLREWQIIGGRLRGLWMQFLPSTVLLLGVWLYTARLLNFAQEATPSVVLYGTTLLTLPAIGLYHSLARKNFLRAFLSTLLMGFFIPVLLARASVIVWSISIGSSVPWFYSDDNDLGWLLAPLIQLIFGGACILNLRRNLKLRHYVLAGSPA